MSKKGKTIKGTIQPPKKVGSQVDELSNKTLGSYVKRASSDNAVNNMAKGMGMAYGNDHMRDQAAKLAKKREKLELQKRQINYQLATNTNWKVIT